MLTKFRNYLNDDSAVDGSVEKIMFIGIAIGVATIVGFYLYNTIAKQADNSSCENNDSPFCIDNGDSGN